MLSLSTPDAAIDYAYPAGGNPRPHAVTQTQVASGPVQTTHSYDANGSMTSRTTAAGTDSVRYDPLRRPVRLKRNQQTVWRAAYDGDGVRRKRLDDSGTFHDVGTFQRNVGNGRNSTTETITKKYSALGRLIAFRKDGVLHWVGTDHPGSTIRLADTSFASMDQQRYRPFGAKRVFGTEGQNLGVDHQYLGVLL